MRHHDELMRQRSEALESEFFRRYDAALVGRMRYQARVTEERDALAEASHHRQARARRGACASRR